jgi:hypothetical protein
MPPRRQTLPTPRTGKPARHRRPSSPSNAATLNTARTGKTTAITQLGKTIEVIHRRRHPGSGGDTPAVYLTVPPAATPRMIAMEFARFFGLPVSRRSNITDILEAACGVCPWTPG